MSAPVLHVIRPGLLTTVQDLGRWGWQARGVPVAGPMDACSHRLANALAGNPRDAATLEITLTGPELLFEDSRTVAVAGAGFAITVDGRDIETDASGSAVRVSVAAGSRLAFGSRRHGARAYLAVRGGIAVPPVLGSRATHLPSRMGGVEGRALVAGDRLPLGDTPADVRAPRPPRTVDTPGEPVIRVLPGPQEDLFTSDAFDQLEASAYRIAIQSDRIGFRLDGPALTRTRSTDIISDPSPLGAMQVPPSGQPIVLMADRQTTGGYPKLATVISADIARLGQLAPGDSLRFRRCSLKDALAARIAQERILLAVEARA